MKISIWIWNPGKDEFEKDDKYKILLSLVVHPSPGEESKCTEAAWNYRLWFRGIQDIIKTRISSCIQWILNLICVMGGSTETQISEDHTESSKIRTSF